MKSIRLAIVGCGGYVRRHVRDINDHVPEFRVVALVDSVKGKPQSLRKELLPRRRVAIYDDHRKMLSEVRPDAVIIATPHSLHYAHARDAVRAGAHVLVEKPMVTDSGQARRLVAAAKKHDRDVQIGIQGTYTDTFAYARQLLADGQTGPLQLVTGILAQGWMKGTAGTWRQKLKLSGGGQLYDSTAHVLSSMVFLVNSPVREVSCFTDNKQTEVDINAVGWVRFANGCLGTITSGGNCAGWYSHLIFQTEGAVMEISPHGGNFRVAGRGMEEITAVPKGFHVPTVTPTRNFADVILGRDEPRCPASLGMLLAELMDALYASAKTGRPVKVKGN